MMDITKSKRFNSFISQKRDDAFRILTNRLNFSLSNDEKAEVFQDSAIALYKKIDSGILTKLKCKQESNGIKKEVEFSVLADEATPTLFTYFVEICYRQALKLKEKKYGKGANSLSSKKAKHNLMESYGVIKDNDFEELTLNYTGYQKENVHKKYIEMDGTISNDQCKAILNVCNETDNSIYREIISQALDTLASRCKDLLGSYYSHKTNWSDIAAKLGINGGADSAKSAASRCRKTLFERCHEIERKRIW